MSDPELRVNTSALNWEPAEVTVPSVPAVAPGGDPMSVMIAAFMPTVPTDVTEGVAAARAREERFAANLDVAKSAYRSTDSAGQAQIQAAGESINPASGPVGGGGSSAEPSTGQASQLSQLMGLPMQMAQQAAQVPMQAVGALGQIPQSVSQGAQSAVQQVGQLSGMGGNSTGDDAKDADAVSPDADQQGEAVERKPQVGSEAGAGSGGTGGGRVPPLERLDAPEAAPGGVAHAKSAPETAL